MESFYHSKFLKSGIKTVNNICGINMKGLRAFLKLKYSLSKLSQIKISFTSEIKNIINPNITYLKTLINISKLNLKFDPL